MANKSKTIDRDFIIENNIIKGKEVTFSTEYTNTGKLLLDRMKAKPDFVGQIDVITEETYTFEKMYDYTVKCALWLRRQGIQKNDVISLCCPNIMNSFAPIFASFCVGAIFTPWNPAMDTREARYFMKLSKPKIVFADENSVDTILEAARLDNYDIKIVVFGESSIGLPFSKVLEGNRKSDLDKFECTPIDNIHDTAAIFYTSGTTGLPKGIEVSHFGLLYNLYMISGFNVEGIPLWFSQYFWITGIILTLTCIVNYVVRLLYPKFEEEMACKIIEEYKVTWVFMSPSMVNRILSLGYFKKYDVSSIRTIRISGNRFAEESQNMLQECMPNANIEQMFGMTELSGVVTIANSGCSKGSVGTITNNAEIKIIDIENENALGPNEKGELLVKLIKMSKGYYNNLQATKHAIDANGWFHTGDLAYYNENGEIFIVDRLKEIIKYRGYHVSPCEIENLLLTHPKIVDVGIVSVTHLEDDEHPIAFVKKVPDSKVTERELQEFVAKNMTEIHHLRGGVKFLDNLPYTASGKISKKILKAMAKEIIN